MKNIKVWRCPKCRKKSIIININKSKLAATISCGACSLFIEKQINRISEPIDVYGDFIDEYYENPSKLYGKNNDKSESNSTPIESIITLPEITTKNIINAISTHWKNIIQLREDLKIETDLDIRYLMIKLKHLERNDRIDLNYTGDEIFCRKANKGNIP